MPHKSYRAYGNYIILNEKFDEIKRWHINTNSLNFLLIKLYIC